MSFCHAPLTNRCSAEAKGVFRGENIFVTGRTNSYFLIFLYALPCSCVSNQAVLVSLMGNQAFENAKRGTIDDAQYQAIQEAQRKAVCEIVAIAQHQAFENAQRETINDA